MTTRIEAAGGAAALFAWALAGLGCSQTRWHVGVIDVQSDASAPSLKTDAGVTTSAGDAAAEEDASQAPPLVGSCVVVAQLFGDDACREDWNCGEGGILSLGCEVGDGGAGCACVTGERVLASGAADATVCSDSGGLARAASAICGWPVQ